jgi:predicted dienelactone hydrolase
MVAENADPAIGSFPLLILSHGAFGAARNYSWIAECLTRQGNIVAGVSHYSESWVYGPGTIDPATASAPWLRPPDCTAALDILLDDTSPFRSIINPVAIGAIGHSSGGATVIALSGAVFSPAAMQDYCASDPARGDKGCSYGDTRLPPPKADESTRSYRDHRIRAIIALDPALGPGYPASTLAEVKIPVLVVGAVDNDFLPFEWHAAHYARHIPKAALLPLTTGEGHFVYLDSGHSDQTAAGVSLCRDRPGVDRDQVHHRLCGVIADFFAYHLF